MFPIRILLVGVVCFRSIYSAEDPQPVYNSLYHFPYWFPQNYPFSGLFLAVAVPIWPGDLPSFYNVFISYNIEFNWNLPQNGTSVFIPPLVSASQRDQKGYLERKNVYSVLEFKLNQHGYAGKECLLRTICETALYALDDDGIFGHLLHILLTPSSSKNVELAPAYYAAEKYGKFKTNCKKYNKKCPVSFVEMFSSLANYV